MPPALEALLTAEPLSISRLRNVFGGDTGQLWSGPAFLVPELPARLAVELTAAEVGLLSGPFAWLADELAHCSPAAAVVESGRAVSICFCSASAPELPRQASRRSRSIAAAGTRAPLWPPGLA